jgi:hypothetical protein
MDGKCYCSAGFFGEYCQFKGTANQFYEPVPINGKRLDEHGQPTNFAEEDSGSGSKSSGWGFFSWYLLFFILALIHSAIIFALLYFLCRDKFDKHVMNKDKDKDKDKNKDKGRKSDANK